MGRLVLAVMVFNSWLLPPVNFFTALTAQSLILQRIGAVCGLLLCFVAWSGLEPCFVGGSGLVPHFAARSGSDVHFCLLRLEAVFRG